MLLSCFANTVSHVRDTYLLKDRSREYSFYCRLPSECDGFHCTQSARRDPHNLLLCYLLPRVPNKKSFFKTIIRSYTIDRTASGFVESFSQFLCCRYASLLLAVIVQLPKQTHLWFTVIHPATPHCVWCIVLQIHQLQAVSRAQIDVWFCTRLVRITYTNELHAAFKCICI